MITADVRTALRWFGPGTDPIPLEYIRQIPGLTGVVSTLYHRLPGEVWSEEEILSLKQGIEAHGLELLGIESLNVGDGIKAGLEDRDRLIENYIASLDNLGRAGIRLICYNFMPVFDWTRSDLHHLRPDGSRVFSYSQKRIDEVNPQTMGQEMSRGAEGFVLPGWEPERLANIARLFELYRPVDEDQLRANLFYFLNAIEDVCARHGIVMALHPDDPPWPVFGLPRIAGNRDQLLKIIKGCPADHNRLTFCTGSLGANPENDIAAMAAELAPWISFVHARNIHHTGDGEFEECAHLSSDGSLDMYEIIHALMAGGFKGVLRPDHGREIWGEKAFPGYGLYDRALGLSYLHGLMEAIAKQDQGIHPWI